MPFTRIAGDSPTPSSASVTPMNVELFVLDCPSVLDTEYEAMNRPTSLKMAAKRYTKGLSERRVHGLTLLFTHCIGAHKEQWEPLIDRLFDLQQRKDSKCQIREAWSFDWQSHGDSAVLNRDKLKESRPYATSGYEWAAAIATFVESSRMKDHRIVPFGHSAGAGAMVHSTRYLRCHCAYMAIILIEPSFLPRGLFHSPDHQDQRMAALQRVYSATAARPDTWRSREDAFRFFRKRVPYCLWDNRVLRLYVEHGLKDTDENNNHQVTLKCDKEHEAISYCDAEPAFDAAVHLKTLSHSLPIHLVWGTRNDFIPEFVQKVVADPAEGRKFASVSKVEGCGHMVVQENPDRLAFTVAGILDITVQEGTTSGMHSKL